MCWDFPGKMAALAWGPSVETKIHSFVEFAQSKLEANADGLTDGEGDDYEVGGRGVALCCRPHMIV